MRILAISDEIEKKYYDYFRRGMLDEFDLILACGDLKKEYLEFLVTMAHCPLFYVRGNHDEGFLEHPPEGCTCIDGKLVCYRDLRIVGLGGSYRYRPGENQYSERKMQRRIRKLFWPIRKHNGFDILLTHAPARGINDFDNIAHRGFVCFRKLLERYTPDYFIHGHIHLNYAHGLPRKSKYGGTTVINACGSYAFSYPEEIIDKM